MLIISTSDDHLSPFIWTRHRSIAHDAYYAMGMITGEILQLKKAVGDEEVIVLKAGDIFDTTTPDPYTEDILKMNIKALLDAGIKVFSVQGNHEFHAKKARATLFDTVSLSMQPTVVDGVSFCGIDYTASREELQEKISMLPPCDYLVMHSPFRHLLGFADKFQVEKEDIPAHVKNVIVGDIHKQSLITSTQGVNILSPGASHPRKIPEIAEGHGMYVHKHETGMINGEFVNVLSRQFYVTTVKCEQDMDDLRALTVEQPEGTLQPVIILQVVGDFYKTAVHIAEAKGALVVPKAILELNEAADKIEDIHHVEIPTLVQSLPSVIQQKKEPEAFDLLEQLLTTTDPEGALDKVMEKYFLGAAHPIVKEVLAR